MNAKKLTGLILCALLCIGIFTGCVQKPKGDPTPSPSAGVSPTAETLYINPGDEYRVYYYFISEENNVYNTDDFRSSAMRDRLNSYKQDYDLTVTFLSFRSNWFDDFLSSAYSSTPIAELMYAGGPHTMNQQYLYQSVPGSALGSFSDYTDVATFDDPEYWDTDSEKFATYGGKLYFICPRLIGGEVCKLNQVTFFNYSMVKEGGYEPDQLYEWSRTGKWTWDKFREVAIACNKPESDIYGLATAQENSLAYNLMLSNGGDYIEKRTVDGKEIDRFVGMEEKSIQAWDFFLKLAKDDKVVRPNSMSGEGDAFSNGKYAMMLTYINRTDIITEKMEDEYGMLMVPKPTEDAKYVSGLNWFMPYCMFANIANPKGVVQFMNKFYQPLYARSAQENKDLFEAEVSTFAHNAGSIETCRMTMDAVKYQSVMIYSMEVGNILWNATDSMISGETTPAVYFSSIEEQVNAIIDKYVQAIEQG